jgi:hypothetical protein
MQPNDCGLRCIGGYHGGRGARRQRDFDEMELAASSDILLKIAEEGL